MSEQTLSSTVLVQAASLACWIYQERLTVETSDNLAWQWREDPDRREALLVIRGSDDWKDWLYNFRAFPRDTPGGRAHGGFVVAARTIRARILDRARKVLAKHYRLLITGHSAGGAVAALMPCMLRASLGEHVAGQIDVVTFAAPPTWWSKGAAESLQVRIFHKDDPVPNCVPFLKHRQHELIALDDKGWIDAGDHAMERYLELLGRRFGLT